METGTSDLTTIQRQGANHRSGSITADQQTAHDQIYVHLDLSVVRQMAQRQHADWTDPQLDNAERCYRNFLWVCWYSSTQSNTDELAGICEMADEMWHAHMLLPRKYAVDCASIFGAGHILDHYPGGVGGEPPVDDAAKAIAAALYTAAGVQPCQTWAECVWAQTTLV